MPFRERIALSQPMEDLASCGVSRVVGERASAVGPKRLKGSGQTQEPSATMSSSSMGIPKRRRIVRAVVRA